jgi:hypothetical protein
MHNRWTRAPLALALCQILCMATGTRAQSTSAPETPQEPSHATADHVASFPLDVAGYLAVRNLVGDDLADRNVFREYSGSTFLSKTIGR